MGIHLSYHFAKQWHQSIELFYICLVSRGDTFIIVKLANSSYKPSSINAGTKHHIFDLIQSEWVVHFDREVSVFECIVNHNSRLSRLNHCPCHTLVLWQHEL